MTQSDYVKTELLSLQSQVQGARGESAEHRGGHQRGHVHEEQGGGGIDDAGMVWATQ